jgi:hypothetical protein
MKKRFFIFFFILNTTLFPTRAIEGMWIPMLLEKYNIEEMQAMGFQLSADDVYNINQASLKDAVVLFGRGCTGELISDQGLIITNHHCGYRQIQQHSSVENDYLTNGFWAMSPNEELINPALSVTFLKRMEDVTEQVLNGVDETTSISDQEKRIAKNIKIIKAKAIEDTHYEAVVKSFFHGNQYFLFINERFTDVRLVGAPPSAIGKFGGDTDNWMWPRHTGDFSLFRIYANKDNKPASYSKENVPYKPQKHFPISLKGVEEGDFTMVFGYPGSTYQYVPSQHIKMLTETINPKRIDIRTTKLDIMNRYQEADPKVRIQYAAKNARISNSWKRWKGESRGLAILNAVEKKQKYENRFNTWCASNDELQQQYGSLIKQYSEVYPKYEKYYLASEYYSELITRNGIEIAQLAGQFDAVLKLIKDTQLTDKLLESTKRALQELTEVHFKDYHAPIDREITERLLTMFKENIGTEFHPDLYSMIDKKHKGSLANYTHHLFSKSVFASEEAIIEMLSKLNEKTIKKLKKDPALILYNSFHSIYEAKINGQKDALQSQLDKLNKSYMTAQMTFEKDRHFYPDANLSLRVSYGQVKGYKAKDAVYYKHYTTLDGIMEKDNPDIYDYRVPQKLKSLYHQKDFGEYAVNGTVPVCFAATNHTTGGNSGSPVLNAHGHLIGINFDRAWEGVMSDLMFNPEQCRNISLDIRYVIFLIDKFASAGYLLNEMTIIR